VGRPPQPARRSRPRSLFLPGFVLGFALLALGSCGGMAVALGLNRLSLADLQNPGAAWTPPPVAPTPAVAEVVPAAVDQVSTRFAPGQAVRNVTNSRVNVRAAPGYLSKPSGDVLGVVAPGATLEILGDSAAADNLVWWRVQVRAPDGAALEGWVAEATASGVQILGE
jgi:hypothetical protein